MAQAVDRIGGPSNEQIKRFVFNETVDRFIEDPEAAIAAYRQFDPHSSACSGPFFQVLLEKAVVKLVSQRNYAAINDLCNGKNLRAQFQKILSEPKVLTEDEIQKIHENVDLNL